MNLLNKIKNSLTSASMRDGLFNELDLVLRVAFKSLFFGPMFFGSYWLIARHAPTHDMWYAFFFAAYMFTGSRKKLNQDAGEEIPRRTQSSIVLPASADKNRERRN